MGNLFDPTEALTTAQTLLKTPQRFQAWLAADPERLFRASRRGRSGSALLARFLVERGVSGVYQGSEHLYVGMTPLQVPEWTTQLALPTHRNFLARYVLWRLAADSRQDAATAHAGEPLSWMDSTAGSRTSDINESYHRRARREETHRCAKDEL